MRKYIFISALLLLNVLHCHTQDISSKDLLEEVIISQRRSKKIPGGNQTWIDTLLIEQKIHQSLSELLSESSPVFIKAYGRGTTATISFRGTAASHTQTLWNGLRVHSPASGVTDFSLIPAFLLDEVTLYHGAASLATNAGSIGGSVILESAPRWKKKEEITYIQGIGSNRTFESMFSIQRANDRWLSRTRLYHQHSDNDFRYKNKERLGIRQKQQNLAGTYRKTLPPHTDQYQRGLYLMGIFKRIVLQAERESMAFASNLGQRDGTRHPAHIHERRRADGSALKTKRKKRQSSIFLEKDDRSF